MRTLVFKSPHKISRTVLTNDYLNSPGKQYFERTCTVMSKHGIVVVQELKWEHNHGISNFTFYSTVINGIKHWAYCDEAKLSERQLKWMATHFIKKVISGLQSM